MVVNKLKVIDLKLDLDENEIALALINNNDLLHERSFKEICQLGVELTDEFMKHESEKGKV